MDKVICLLVVLAVFFVKPNDSTRWSNWKIHATQFGENAKWGIEYASKGNASCSQLGKELLSQQVSKVYNDFDECKSDVRCSLTKERLFHKRADEIETLVDLCANSNCTKLDYIDSKNHSSAIQTAIQCSYFDLIRDPVRRWISGFGGEKNSSCLVNIRPDIRSAAFEFTEHVHNCTKKISPRDIADVKEEMENCTRIYQNDFDEYVRGERSTFISCTRRKSSRIVAEEFEV